VRRNLILFLVGTLAVSYIGREIRLTALGSQSSTAQAAHSVLLDLHVTDPSGRFVSGLTKSNFRVEENGTPEGITTVDAVEDNGVFTLLLDDIGVSPLRSGSVRALAHEFVERHIGPTDRVRLVTTSRRKDLTLDFTSDKGRVLAAIDRFQGGQGTGQASDGLDALYELHDQTASLSSDGRRKAIVFIGVGLPSGLYLAPSRLSTAAVFDLPRERTNARFDIRDVILAAARNTVVISCLDAFGNVDQPSELPDIVQYRLPFGDSVGGRTTMAFVARETGGTSLIQSNAIEPAFTEITEAERRYYRLAYISTNLVKDSQFAKVSVSTDERGLSVHTRSGVAASPQKTTH